MHDDFFDDRFAAFRAGGPLVVPAGPGAAREVYRHRRRVHAAAGGAVAALLVATPVAALVTVDDRPDVPNVSDSGAPTLSPSTSAPSPTAAPPRARPRARRSRMAGSPRPSSAARR